MADLHPLPEDDNEATILMPHGTGIELVVVDQVDELRQRGNIKLPHDGLERKLEGLSGIDVHLDSTLREPYCLSELRPDIVDRNGSQGSRHKAKYTQATSPRSSPKSK